MKNTAESEEDCPHALELRLNAHLEQQLSRLKSTLDEHIVSVASVCLNQEKEIKLLGSKIEDRFDSLQCSLLEIARSLALQDSSRFGKDSNALGCLQSSLDSHLLKHPAPGHSRFQNNHAGDTAGSGVEAVTTHLHKQHQIFAEEWSPASSNNPPCYALSLHFRHVVRAWRQQTQRQQAMCYNCNGGRDSADDAGSTFSLDSPSMTAGPDGSPGSPLPQRCRRKSFADLIKCKRMFETGPEEEESEATAAAEAAVRTSAMNPLRRVLRACSGRGLLELVFGVSGPNVYLGHDGSRAIHPNSPFAAGPLPSRQPRRSLSPVRPVAAVGPRPSPFTLTLRSRPGSV